MAPTCMQSKEFVPLNRFFDLEMKNETCLLI